MAAIVQNSLSERRVSEILKMKTKVAGCFFFFQMPSFHKMHTWGHHRVKIPSGGVLFHCLVFVQRICSLFWQDFVSPLIRMT